MVTPRRAQRARRDLAEALVDDLNPGNWSEPFALDERLAEGLVLGRLL